jgi:mono/diheme cytochrome c family protein
MRNWKTCPPIGFIGLCAGLALTASAGPFDAVDVQAGKEIATTACLPCHATPSTRDQESPSSRIGPPLSEIAKGKKATHENLRNFLLSTHSNIAHPGAMPSPELTEKQIWQIAAYLSSLRNEQD